MPKKFALLFIWLLIVETGCISYHEKPLSDDAVDAKLSAPSMAVLKIEARSLKHPILRPVEIDEQKGLTPDGAAILAVLINPELKAERDKKGVSAAQLYQAGILPNPQFSGSSGFPRSRIDAGNADRLRPQPGLRYSIPDHQGAGNQDAARLQDTSVALDVAWQEWQVAEAAKRHAYRLYLLEKQLGVAKDEEKGLQENFDAVKRAVDSAI